jgi:hypothetical protein
MNGRQLVGRAGETVTVPRGARHIAFNDRDAPLVCIVDYKPGLDHYTIMQCFAGLTIDGAIDNKGLVNIPKIMYLLKRARAQSLPRPAFAPEALFRFGMNIFYAIGLMAGWNALYQKYTGLQ